MALTIWVCGGAEDFAVAWGRMLADEQERERDLEEDLEHELHPDLEMMAERLDVDPYAPELPFEVVEPETVDAAVWEGLMHP